MHGLSLVVASGGYSSLQCVGFSLSHCGFSCCRAWALGAQASVVVAHGLSCSAAMWDLPMPGFEPVSPALAGGFLTTAPPGKPLPQSYSISFHLAHPTMPSCPIVSQTPQQLRLGILQRLSLPILTALSGSSMLPSSAPVLRRLHPRDLPRPLYLTPKLPPRSAVLVLCFPSWIFLCCSRHPLMCLTIV